MADRQSIIPGGGVVHETGTEESVIPGVGVIAEDQAAAGGVDIAVPLKTFTLAKLLPTIETGVNIPVSAPKAFSLTKFTLAVGTGVDVLAPVPKAFSLAGFDPEIASGVNIPVPVPKAYTLTDFVPVVEAAEGTDIIVPSPKAYSLDGQLPTIQTGVTVISPAPKAYSLSGFDPIITAAVAAGIEVAVVSGLIDHTASQITNFVKTGFGTPKACIVLHGFDETDDVNVDVTGSHMSIGFSDFTGQFCIAHQDEDGSDRVDCDAIKSNTACYILLNISGGVQTQGTASAITDGVALTSDAAGGSSIDSFVTVIMFGGTDLTIDLVNAAINSSLNGTVAPTVALKDNDDKLMFFIGSDIATEDSPSSGINNSFGVCHAAGSDGGGWAFAQRCISWASDHNNVDGSPAALINNEHVLDMITETGAEDWALEVTGLSASGNTLTLTTRDVAAGANMEVYALVLDLGSQKAKVGSVDAPTSGATWTPSVSLGFTPQYVGLGITRLTSENVVNQSGLAGVLGLSSNTGSGEETCHSWYNEAGAVTTNTNNLFRSRAVDIRFNDISAVTHDYSHLSFNSGDWTYTINTEVGGSARKWFYWAIEASAAISPDIIVPLEAFTLAGQLPTIETGVNVPVPVPKSYTLTKFTPAVGVSAAITVPAPKTYTLAGFDPTIETGVTIITPLNSFTLAGFDPAVNTGVNVIIPAPKTFTLTGFDPTVDINIDIITPLGTFNLTGFAPNVGIDIVITVPLGSFTRTNFVPGVVSGVGIAVPVHAFTLNSFVPVIATAALIVVPAPKAYTLTGFDPVIALEFEIRVPLKQFDLIGFDPIIHSNRPPILAANILDLTPPFTDIDQIRYLFRNFAVIRDLLEEGVDGQFTTSDGKTALVRGGVIVDLF